MAKPRVSAKGARVVLRERPQKPLRRAIGGGPLPKPKAKPPSWESWYAMESRAANLPTYPNPRDSYPGWALDTRDEYPGSLTRGDTLGPPHMLIPTKFKPNAKLDPSQVVDNRGDSLVRDIWRWFVNQSITIPIAHALTQRKDFAPDTGFGKLQRSYDAFQQGRTRQPQPGPAPVPMPTQPKPAASRITNPGLLSKYRR